MSGWIEVLSGVAWEHLALALLHTLWQGAVLAGLTGLILRAIPAAQPNFRYAVCLGSLLAVVLAGLGTWHVLDLDLESAIPPTTHRDIVSPPSHAPPSFQAVPSLVEHGDGALPASRPRTAWAVWLVVAWVAGASLMLVRMILSVAGIRRLRREAQSVADSRILAIVDQLRARLGIARKVGVLVVQQLRSPAVLGIVSPALVLPAALATGMDAACLEAILAHELAHIRRYDYLVNLGQMVIESLLFFNPAVWWLSRQIRLEREACCDAVAVAITGGAIDYAQCLADCANRLRGASTAAAPAMAFAHNERYVLLERVRRILVPGYRPRLRLSWFSLSIFVILAAVLAVGLWHGTLAAVIVAAKALSPQERMERIVEAERKYAPLVTTRQEGDQRVTIAGTIETEDGQPVPKKTELETYTQTPRGSASGMAGQVGPSFKTRVGPGAIWLMVTSDQYAPAVVGPFRGEPGGRIDDVKITLRRGFVGRLRLVDEQGRPIPRIKVQGGLPMHGFYSVEHWTTDEDGAIVFPHANDRPYEFTVHTPGFELDRKRDVQLRPNESVVWQLRQAVPTTGVIRSKSSRMVAGATIRLLAEIASAQTRQTWGVGGPVLSTTDEQGRFRLDTLHRDRSYVLLVDAGEKGRHLVQEVKAGQQDREIQLGPKLTIRGKVIGDLGRLKQANGRPVLGYRTTVTVGQGGFSDLSQSVPVRIEGGEGHFVIENLLPGRVELHAGPRDVSMEVREPIDGLVIDLAKQADPPTRRVVLRFEPPEGSPHAQGTVKVYLAPAKGQSDGRSETFPIKDGRVETEAYVGQPFEYQPEQVLGYWFQQQLPWPSVPAGPGPWEIRVPLIPAGAIAGRVLGVDGQPVAEEVRVNVRTIKASKKLKDGRLMSSDVSSVDGHFMFTQLPLGGTYVVAVYRQMRANLHESEPISLDEANPVEKLELRLAPGKDAQVQMVGPDEKPLARVPLSLSTSVIGTHWESPETRTDEQGRFRFAELNPATAKYRVRAKPRSDYQPAEAELLPGGPPTIVRLNRGYVVAGRVLDPSGKPVPGVEVYAIPAEYDPAQSHCEAESVTDAEGRFRFSTMAKIRYELGIRASGGLYDREVVVGGQAELVELRVKPQK
jgi:beta-lactamase regulating signal transducer with metallopeptidase domain